MTAEIILAALAISLPLAGRWASRHGRWSHLPVYSSRVLAFLSVCALLWVVLAWVLSFPEEPGARFDIALFVVTPLFGAVWVEACLLLWRGRRQEQRRRARKQEVKEERLGDLEEDESLEELGDLSEEAQGLLVRTLGLQRVLVDAVMTPREDIAWVEGNSTAGEGLARMRRAGRTRIVVAEGSLDRVLGIAHAKDLAPLVAGGGAGRPIRSVLRRWLRVSRNQTAGRLLEEFRRNRVTMGLIGDVRGRTLGLVTPSDVYQFVVGIEREKRR